MMKRAELGRYTADEKGNPAGEGAQVSPWEMREYFEMS